MEDGSVTGSEQATNVSSHDQQTGIATRRRVVLVVAVLVAVLALARCGGDVVALGRTDAANSDQAFRNGSFLIKVSGLGYAVEQIDVDAPQAGGLAAHKPKSGQFIVFYAEATNVGFTRASMPSASSTLSDAAGKKYPAAGPFIGGDVRGAVQGFDEEQLPGTTRSGWFVFDVPESVTSPTTLNVQSDPNPATTNPPTLVKFG